MRATVVVVGDEILSGHVRDANAHFIAERLAIHGHDLARILVVSDDPAEIERAVGRELREGDVQILFVCGGLGPTHDDRTMEGVAAAVGRSLESCPDIERAIEGISTRLREQGFAADPLGLAGLAKMALVPAGAEAIRCSTAFIPAVTLEHSGVRLIALPGPPRELKAVFLEAVEPSYLVGTGEPVECEEVEHFFPESALAAGLVGLAKEFPEVKIGSYPMEDRVIIRIAGHGASVADVAGRVREAIATLATSEDGRRLMSMWARRSRRGRSGQPDGSDLPRP